jgi:cytochrome P450
MDLDAQGKEPNSTHPTIFHGFLNDPDLPLADRTAEHFVHEAQAIVVAGQITTGYLLSTTCWYILSTPRVLARVKTELFEVMPDPATLPSLKAVEDLPYLSAVVAEGHRLTHGISHRSPRLSNFPIQFGEYSIPPRTPVGMTQMLIHQNSFLFSDPFTFKPERWLDIPNVHPNMHPLRKYLLSFSRGTRSCLGMHLAQAEIYMALAAVFRRFDFDIFGTTQADIDIVADFLTPFPREGSKGLRVLVR